MEMKKSIVLFLGLLLLTSANAQLNCVTGILPTLLPCHDFLTSLLPVSPGAQCCAAADKFCGSSSPANLCQCLKLNLRVAGFLDLKLKVLPTLCSLSNLGPIVGCVLGGAPKA